MLCQNCHFNSIYLPFYNHATCPSIRYVFIVSISRCKITTFILISTKKKKKNSKL